MIAVVAVVVAAVAGGGASHGSANAEPLRLILRGLDCYRRCYCFAADDCIKLHGSCATHRLRFAVLCFDCFGCWSLQFKTAYRECRGFCALSDAPCRLALAAMSWRSRCGSHGVCILRIFLAFSARK